MEHKRYYGALIIGLAFAKGSFGQAGTLDPDFSADGYTTINWSEGDVSGAASALDANGDIYVAGTLSVPPVGSVPAQRRIAIVRLNADGGLDPGFSGNGRLLAEFTTSGFSWSFVRAMAIQADGKIIVVGEAAVALTGGGQSTHQFGVARFNSNGTPDTDFSGDGLATVSFIDDAQCRPWDVVVQSDGKILVAGWTNTTTDDDSELNFAVLRLNATGSLDNSFSSDGKVQVDFGVYDSYAHAVEVQSDGKIVLAGTYDYSDGDSKMVVARLNASGTLDNTFSDDGKYQYTSSSTTIENAWAVAIDADNRVLVAGQWQNSDGSGYIQPTLIRLGTTGALDNGFSSNGEFHFTGPQGHGAGIRKLDIQCDGKIMATGYSVDTDDDEDMLLARITSGGELDDNFSSDGLVTLAFGFGNDIARGVSILSSDQYITIAGTAGAEDDATDFGVARYRTEAGIVPPAPTITFNEAECELTASGPGTFQWENEIIPFPPTWFTYAIGNPVAVSAADDYRVRVTAPNGCVSPWSAVFELEQPCTMVVDCEGVAGGDALPGTPCDDGTANTGNDTWSGACACVGETIDCEGVIGGPALPGTVCDDGSAVTVNDAWSNTCECVGNDCEGVPGGTALPGNACDDGDPNTGDDMWTADCDCVGETIDCEGVTGGPALPGTPCDDGNGDTINDTWIIGCTCIGAVGIDEVAGNLFAVSAFPNPFRGALTVAFTLKESANMGIELRDVSGRMLAVMLPVMNRPGGEQRYTLNMPHELAKGTYLLVLTGDAGRAVVRVTK